ncbi:L,D-transpeptidase family protein [Stenotrophomonas sp.]|uniref:L,D-transpeptidase family protein n=1 Tax=Stenotrophomonas sp. TaxID=69392 RepID=UPI002FCC5F85
MLPLLRTVLAVAMVATTLPAAALSPPAPPLLGSSQVVVVTTAGWDATEGQLQAYERTGQGWQRHGSAFTVAVGRQGSAWGIGLVVTPPDGPQKQEGDGRSPAGVFAIGPAFGYAATAASALPYQPMQAGSYCMDVPDSPYYNRIVDAEVVGAEAVEGSTEPMRLDLHNKGDVRYRQGFVIEHNPAAVPGRGSCIFAHLWRTPGEPTAGCTAMPPAHMQALLGWLDPARNPRFVLMPRSEYQRLQAPLQLPVLAEAAP